MKGSPKDEQRLMVELWDPRIADDLRAFVRFVYPWDKPGTPLEGIKGPRNWQDEDFKEISDHLAAQRKAKAEGAAQEVFRKATASGRGIGKTAELGMVAHWLSTTRLGSTVVVTANSEDQLKTRTFAEMGKWFSMAINAHWFDSQALMIRPAAWLASAVEKQRGISPKYWYIQGQLWSKDNPGGFAGVHNPLGLLVIFDEAAGIPQPVWEVTDGFFTEENPNRLWLAYSQGRDQSGGFYDAFHKKDPLTGEPFWKLRQLDSRTVEGADQAFFERQIREHGIDSDFARVEVLGQFPNAGANQFISNSLVFEAQRREVVPDHGAPLMMGVDVGRSLGRDPSVIRFRQGNDARSIPPVAFRSNDLYVIADRVALLIDEHRPDAVCIDQGMGAGVIDILKRRNYRTHEIAFGTVEGIDPQWGNKGTAMYADLRDWLRAGGCIDNSTEAAARLFTDLTARNVVFWGSSKDKLKLESKEDFRGRTRRSPDDGDALALTFGTKVARRDARTNRQGHGRDTMASGLDYPIFG
jgi:hypothetical protein